MVPWSSSKHAHAFTPSRRMRACLRRAAVAVPACRARRYLKPRCAAQSSAARRAGGLSSPATSESAAVVSSTVSPPPPLRSSNTPVSEAKREATPMRGLTGDAHPSVNLPPLRLPADSLKTGPGSADSAFGSADGVLRVGRDFNRAKFDPVANSKFLDDRPWGVVDAFAAEVVKGDACVSQLVTAFETERAVSFEPPSACDGEGVAPNGVFLKNAQTPKPRKTPRRTYRFTVSYYGPGFSGWAWNGAQDGTYCSKDGLEAREEATEDFEEPASERRTPCRSLAAWSPGAFSCVAAVQRALEPLFRGEPTRPLYASGRTDRGVHGVAQTVSFSSKRDLNLSGEGSSESFREKVVALVARSPAGRLGHVRVVDAPPPREAHEKFHATFCCTWRRYVYVFPLRQSLLEERTPEKLVDVDLLNSMLGALETSAAPVDCHAFARDTPKGKSALVNFIRARAFLGAVPVPLPRQSQDAEDAARAKREPEPVVVVELVANRFLRKLVRVLVATAAREAATGAKPDILLALAAARERSATASPAPAGGLFFAGVGYGEHPVYDERF